MNKRNSMIILPMLTLSASVLANFSSTVSIVSDYTFNGVSQTNNSPALQASLDYSDESGIYLGTWASNVDFGSQDDTNLEWDFYAGIFKQIDKSISTDFGVAQYTYSGAENSYTYNFTEVYGKLGYGSEIGNSELNLWYAWDYFGTGAAHYVYKLAHSYEVSDGHTLKAVFAMPTSLDKGKWAWVDKKGNNNNSYSHVRLSYYTSFKGFDFEAAIEGTSLDTKTADSRVVASISRTFNF